MWANDQVYAEFFLEDESGNGRWFPCKLTGSSEFGANSQPSVIEQKGEHIKVPEKDERVRFVNEFVVGKSRGPEPKISFVRERLPDR